MLKKEVEIPTGKILVKGNLSIPDRARSFVIFSHGSGSSRFSVRNNYVAEILNSHGIATLLTDLLTEEEDQTVSNRFDIELLTKRLSEVTIRASQLPEVKGLPVGYFGASTGAASALKAAAALPETIRAVVSRGGRPDLAESDLLKVKAPVLLIVGSLDTDVLMLNEQAYAMIYSEKKLEVVEGATHLFQEEGTLEEVSKLARSWFDYYLSAK